MRLVFEGMDGAPEEEKYKEILKKQQAAYNAADGKPSLSWTRTKSGWKSCSVR